MKGGTFNGIYPILISCFLMICFTVPVTIIKSILKNEKWKREKWKKMERKKEEERWEKERKHFLLPVVNVAGTQSKKDWISSFFIFVPNESACCDWMFEIAESNLVFKLN